MNDETCEECKRLREDSEFWRKNATTWQDWAKCTLSDLGLQPAGGHWGNQRAREVLTEAMLVARGRLMVNRNG